MSLRKAVIATVVGAQVIITGAIDASAHSQGGHALVRST
ncbi:hypothetical protein PAECIP111891_02098 [Paenibacillus allorhizoplanae]|uniref:Uncharacterized protein n=1 Tax=Paenibacillus allorhizoplanae TaxID=2905648 RepID=A0ABM9C4L5_9BACL|nr:hypothetical protein PAECIP111891_02098 [Paenibacillus allorhizoplanae]